MSECGLFAIANATALCGGLDPHLQNFEQSKMREHLTKCFLKNRLECRLKNKFHGVQSFHRGSIYFDLFSVPVVQIFQKN